MNRIISIVVPMRNEKKNIDALFSRIEPVAIQLFEEYGYKTEVIVNDNRSSDGTFSELQKFAEHHDSSLFELGIFRLASNIGFQKSILVGYYKAKGDAVIQIDADLQDPPELIVEFVRRWREGYRVVYGVRLRRREGLILNLARKVFYRSLNRISTDELPSDTGDFRLVDRQLVDVICSLEDYSPYLRGLIASLGCKQIGVPYDRDARVAGRSKFGLRNLASLSIDAITNHSSAPLKFSSYFAFTVAISMVGFSLFYVTRWWFFDRTIPAGFMTQTLLQLGGLGVLSLFFAIQGSYLSRIYSQLKERPLAIVEESVRVDAERKSKVANGDLETIWFGGQSVGRNRS